MWHWEILEITNKIIIIFQCRLFVEGKLCENNKTDWNLPSFQHNCSSLVPLQNSFHRLEQSFLNWTWRNVCARRWATQRYNLGLFQVILGKNEIDWVLRPTFLFFQHIRNGAFHSILKTQLSPRFHLTFSRTPNLLQRTHQTWTLYRYQSTHVRRKGWRIRDRYWNCGNDCQRPSYRHLNWEKDKESIRKYKVVDEHSRSFSLWQQLALRAFILPLPKISLITRRRAPPSHEIKHLHIKSLLHRNALPAQIGPTRFQLPLHTPILHQTTLLPPLSLRPCHHWWVFEV